MLRSVLEGKWRQIHDNIIRRCKIFIFINTLEALESLEIMREISIAFPNGNTSKHSFWILIDKFSAALNSSAFEERTGINLASQNQARFGNESDFNTILLSLRGAEMIGSDSRKSSRRKLILHLLKDVLEYQSKISCSRNY
ncbi:MAG: hypothetical protein M3275_02605 [Thermoproteota archaeon]|nr:hypothetical protein [Thermoproteota archaeon]